MADTSELDFLQEMDVDALSFNEDLFSIRPFIVNNPVEDSVGAGVESWAKRGSRLGGLPDL